MQIVGIIPAVIKSKRLPGKPLLEVGGKPLLQWTYEQVKLTDCDKVLVTSPDREIGNYCKLHDIPFFPSSDTCESGTHRCADVASRFKEESNVGYVVRWAVGEPAIPIRQVNEMIHKNVAENNSIRDSVPLDTLDSPTASIGTMAYNLPASGQETFMKDPNQVKVRMFGSKCVDFTRTPLPLALRHLGIYIFTLDTLLNLGRIGSTKLAKEERLEQLSWLSYCPAIHALVVAPSYPLVSIHTQKDLDSFGEYLKQKDK